MERNCSFVSNSLLILLFFKAENYMDKNLFMRCFYRDPYHVLAEEFIGSHDHLESARHAQAATEDSQHHETKMRPYVQVGYNVVPKDLRASVFSPLLNIPSTARTFGVPSCFRGSVPSDGVEASLDGVEEQTLNGGPACVPAFRLAFTFVYNIGTSAWFDSGALCMGRVGIIPGEMELLYDIGLLESDGGDDEKSIVVASVAEKHGFGPCVHFTHLKSAFKEAKLYLTSLKPKDRSLLRSSQFH
jgi:hypothetical protein